MADAERLERVEAVGDELDGAGDGVVERIPDEIAEPYGEARGPASPGGGMSTCSLARKTSVPNTRRIGWAKLDAVYCVSGYGSG